MSDHPPCGAGVRRQAGRRHQAGIRTARVAALREARRRGDLVIDPDRIARRMLG